MQCAITLGSEGSAAARYLGLSDRTLYRLVNGGKVAAYRFRRVFRYKRADLDRFIERSRLRLG